MSRCLTTAAVHLFRGQQLAQQMQSQNPDLVNRLREQMGRPPTGAEDDSDSQNGSNQQPPKPGNSEVFF